MLPKHWPVALLENSLILPFFPSGLQHSLVRLWLNSVLSVTGVLSIVSRASAFSLSWVRVFFERRFNFRQTLTLIMFTPKPARRLHRIAGSLFFFVTSSMPIL